MASSTKSAGMFSSEPFSLCQGHLAVFPFFPSDPFCFKSRYLTALHYSLGCCNGPVAMSTLLMAGGGPKL